MKTILSALAIWSAAASVMAATITATPANIAAVVKAAQPGDVIQASGAFDHLQVTNRAFSEPLTIAFQPGATVVNLKLIASTGLTITGGEFHPVDWAGGIYCQGSTNVTIQGVRIVDPTQKWNGVTLRDACNQSKVQASTFSGLKIAIATANTEGFALTGNRFSGSGSDAMDVSGSGNGVISDNRCESPSTINGNHPDCIQMWAKAGQTPVHDIKITGNVVLGDMQGIDDFGNVPTGYMTNIVIENNTLAIGYPQTITFTGLRSSRIRNNTIVSVGTFQSMVRAYSPAVDTVICGNYAGPGGGRPAVIDAPCPK